jgi:hypothetical protein
MECTHTGQEHQTMAEIVRHDAGHHTSVRVAHKGMRAERFEPRSSKGLEEDALRPPLELEARGFGKRR